MLHFPPEYLIQNFNPKLDHFDFFILIKNYADLILLIDEKILSHEASYKTQKFSRKLKFPKCCANC